jgi:ABC-type antimicrobial peptide transport system permease subunit
MFLITLKIMLRNRLKNSLVLLQFIFAFVALYMLMTECVNMVNALTKDIGYEQKNLIGAQVTKLWSVSNKELFEDNYSRLESALSEIKELPFVASAGYLWAYPISNYSSSSNSFQRNYADEESFEALGLELVAGRSFNKDDAFSTHNDVVMINEIAYKRFQEKFGTEIIGENFRRLDAQSDTVTITETMPVIGVYRNFAMRGRFQSRLDQNSLSISRFRNKAYYEGRYTSLSRSQSLVIRLNSAVKVSKGIFEVNEILRRNFPDRSVFVYSIEELALRQSQGPLQRFFTLLFICAVLTFIISIGIIAITKENLSKRIKEIGIRMALGSTEGQIVRNFISELFLMSLLASVISSLVIYFLNEYQIVSFSIRWQEFVFSFLSLTTLSLSSILLPVLKTSKMRPNNALRYE